MALMPVDPAGENPVRVLQRLGLSQESCAVLGISAGTLRGWEQERRQPNRTARVLLRLAAQHPKPSSLQRMASGT